MGHKCDGELVCTVSAGRKRGEKSKKEKRNRMSEEMWAKGKGNSWAAEGREHTSFDTKALARAEDQGDPLGKLGTHHLNYSRR